MVFEELRQWEEDIISSKHERVKVQDLSLEKHRRVLEINGTWLVGPEVDHCGFVTRVCLSYGQNSEEFNFAYSDEVEVILHKEEMRI